MSRSRRHTPVTGFTSCHSEKEDKQIWHRRWRRAQRATLASASQEALESYLPKLAREVSEIWDMGKDGRSRWPISLLRAKGRDARWLWGK
ncbi:MAG: hypothetical protein LBO66_04400 [Deltaproteobacteria bacterium]|jgi:hypothetical protein|nr:hypothetical protein [Deltaproteobacteria bacterium]